MPHFTTSDGCKLFYQEAGSGNPVVLVHGWSQTSQMFKRQIPALSERYRVVALDLRGHGQSDKVNHGYRISRLATDVHEFLTGLGLEGVSILGWSMGCSIIWSYWELFGSDRLSKVILVDQGSWMLRVPWMTDQEAVEAGAVWSAGAQFLEVIGGIRSNREADISAVGSVKWFVGLMVTTDMPQEERDWIAGENLQMPADHAADLLFVHSSLDWRDLIPRMDLPTLVIGGKKSFFEPKSQEWVARQIPGAKVEIFDTGHIMFLEEPDKFNRVVMDFVD